LVNNQSEVVVVEVIRGNSRATVVRFDRDFRFFNDTNAVTIVSDFTEVVVIGDGFYDRRLTESRLNLLGIDYGAEIAIRQVRVARCGWESHDISP